MRPSVGVHTGSCDLLPPSLDVCFDRTSFMPKTMPALCSSTPSGSSSEVGGSGGVFSQLPIQVLAAATMGPEVPQIKSCGLGGQETGKLTHADLSRPQLEVTSQSAVSSQSSGRWPEGPHMPPLGWQGDGELRCPGMTEPSCPSPSSPLLPFPQLNNRHSKEKHTHVLGVLIYQQLQRGENGPIGIARNEQYPLKYSPG